MEDEDPFTAHERDINAVKPLPRRAPNGEMYKRIAAAVCEAAWHTQLNLLDIGKLGPSCSFWGQLANRLCHKDTLKQRKRLHLMWKYNRGSLHEMAERKLNGDVKSDFTSCTEQQSSTYGICDTGTPTTRKERARKQTPEDFVKTEKVFGRRGPASSNRGNCAACQRFHVPHMNTELWIQCDACGKWYHTTCIGIEDEGREALENLNIRKKIKFICGTEACSSEWVVFEYKQRNAVIKLPINTKKLNNIEKPGEVFTETSDINEGTAAASNESSHDWDNKEGDDWPEQLKFGHNTEYSNFSSTRGNTFKTAEPLKHKTLQRLSHSNLPQGLIEEVVPSTAIFKVDEAAWNKLQKKVTHDPYKLRFVTRDWCHLLNRYIEQYNPHCTIMYKRHVIYTKSENDNKTIFRAYGYCKHTECGVRDVRVSLYNSMEGKVSFNTAYVRHSPDQLYARPIAGEERSILKEKLKDGPKAFKERIKRMSQLSGEAIASGNRNSVGKDTQVFRQIAYEARTQGRFDKNEMDSLLKFATSLALDKAGKSATEEDSRNVHKRSLEDDNVGKTITNANIHISLSPLVVTYWNEASVRLFHDLCKHDIIYWDATGKMIHSAYAKKKLLYYEMTARHPKKGSISAPLSVMVSDNHSLPTIEHWLHTFRHAEKTLYGAANLSAPVQFNSDRSLVMILAALRVINLENMEMFLERAWKIVNGESTKEELMKMNVHACAFHFMRDVRKMLRKYYNKRNTISVLMWACSLLMNASSLKEIVEMFALLVRICCYPFECTELEKDKKVLHDYVEKFKIVLKEYAITVALESLDDKGNEIKDRQGTEEEAINRAAHSKFRNKFEEIKRAMRDKCNAGDTKDGASTKNEFHSTAFIDDLCKNLMPTAPLWSGLLLNDLSRHGNTIAYIQYKAQRIATTTTLKDNFMTFLQDNRTIGVSERRMGVMYDIQVDSRSKVRLDDFFRMVNDDIVGIQRTFSDEYRMKPGKRKRNKIVIEESWEKKRKRAPVKVRERGYYQTPPFRNPVMVKRPTASSRTGDENESDAKSPVESNDACSIPVKKQYIPVMEPELEDDDSIQEKKGGPYGCKLVDHLVTQLEGISFKAKYPYVYKAETLEIHMELLKELVCAIFNGLPNKHNNCWFNAAIQAFGSLATAHHILKGASLVDDVDCIFSACLGVLEYIICVKRSNVSVSSMQEKCLREMFMLDRNEFQLNQQHDAQAFITKLIHNFNDRSDEKLFMLALTRYSTCFDCGKVETQMNEDQITMLMLNAAGMGTSEKSMSTVQTLIDDYFADEELKSDCECGKMKNKGYGKVITATPNELAIVIKRYGFDSHSKTPFKVRKPIVPTHIIELHHHSLNSNTKNAIFKDNENANMRETQVTNISTQYRLRAVVIHRGETLCSGHYTTYVFLNEDLAVMCDDENISIMQRDALAEVMTDSYLLFYENVDIIEAAYNSYASVFTTATLIDITPVTRRWPSFRPLNRLQSIRGPFLDGTLPAEDFYKMVTFCSRELMQRADRISGIKPFEERVLSVLAIGNENVGTALIRIAQMKCNECGKDVASLVVDEKFKLKSLNVRDVNEALVYSQSNKECNRCSATVNSSIDIVNSPDMIVVTSRKLEGKDLADCRKGLFGMTLMLPKGRECITFKLYCIMNQHRNNLLLKRRERYYVWNTFGIKVYCQDEFTKYVKGRAAYEDYGEFTAIFIKEQHPKPMKVKTKRVTRTPIPHSIEKRGRCLSPVSNVTIQNPGREEDVIVRRECLLGTLNGQELTSDIMDGYMFILSTAAKKSRQRNVLVLPTSTLKLFETVKGQLRSIIALRRRKTALEGEEQDMIITAYCTNKNHWVGLAFDVTTKCMTYINSLKGDGGHEHVHLFATYLKVFYAAVYDKFQPITSIANIADETTCEFQYDNVSCGAYVCMYLRYLLLTKNCTPIDVNVGSERSLIVTSLMDKNVPIHPRFTKDNVDILCEKEDPTTRFGYKFFNFGTNSWYVMSWKELNAINKEEYSDAFGNQLEGEIDSCLRMISAARTLIGDEIEKLVDTCKGNSITCARYFRRDLTLITNGDSHELRKRNLLRIAHHSAAFTGDTEWLPSLLEVELKAWIQGEHGKSQTHMQLPILGNCCKGKLCCTCGMDLVTCVLVPICLICHVCRKDGVSEEQAIQAIYKDFLLQRN